MTNRPLDLAVSALAHRQFGVFSHRQAGALGATNGIVARRVAAGSWIPVADGVYRLAGFAPSWRASLMTAVLGTGGFVAVSHESAAALHQFASFPAGPVVTTVRHGAGRVRHGGCVHQLDDLLPEHIALRDGLPVTTTARTFVDLAAVCRRARVAHALDDALTSGAADLDAVVACVDSVARRGKPGIGLLRSVLAEHLPGYVPPATELERLLLRALRDAGLRRPALQFPFPGRCAGEARVDAAYPEARLVIEADSRRWHTRRHDFQRDRERDNETVLAGWRVLRFTWDDLTRNPDTVASTVRDALRQRAA